MRRFRSSVLISAIIALAASLAPGGARGAETLIQPGAEVFSSVGQWYRDFTQTTDDEVRQCLAQADARVLGVRPRTR